MDIMLCVVGVHHDFRGLFRTGAMGLAAWCF